MSLGLTLPPIADWMMLALTSHYTATNAKHHRYAATSLRTVPRAGGRGGRRGGGGGSAGAGAGPVGGGAGRLVEDEPLGPGRRRVDGSRGTGTGRRIPGRATGTDRTADGLGREPRSR